MSEPMHIVLSESMALVGLGQTDTQAGVREAQTLVLQLYDECAPGIRRYLRSLSVHTDAVEDIVQEVYLALFRHVCAGRPQDNLRGWLFRVARNAALKRHRRERHLRFLMSELQQPWPTTRHAVGGAEEQLVRREERRRLCAVVQALPHRDRQCVRLRAEGLSYRDIAAAVGISLGSVATSLARAFGRLTRASAR